MKYYTDRIYKERGDKLSFFLLRYILFFCLNLIKKFTKLLVKGKFKFRIGYIIVMMCQN